MGDPVLSMLLQSFLPTFSPAVFGRIEVKLELDGFVRMVNLAVCDNNVGSTGLSTQLAIGLCRLGAWVFCEVDSFGSSF
jgi:hypothetical protein